MSLESALVAERARNARLLSVVRFTGVSAFYLLFVVLGYFLRLPDWQGNLETFTVYWVASALIFVSARENERIASLTPLSLALIDVPIIFFLQWQQFPTSNAGGVAGFNVGVYLFIILLGMLAMDRWMIFGTAAVAVAFEGLLQYLAHISPGAIVATGILLFLAAVVCAFASKRLRDLIYEQVKAQERRGQLERLAAMGQISGSIGHDIRNPLSTIGLAAEQLGIMIQSGSTDAETAEHSLTAIANEITTCTVIVDRLLDFGSERPLTLKPTPLAPLLHDVRVAVQFKIPTHVKLELKAPDGVPEVNIDRDLFRQTLINLVLNAMEAIPEDKQGEVCLSAECDGDAVLVRVKDNGTGIPKDVQPRIFDPLFSTKKSGNGFGLAIAHNIVTRIGAELILDSELGRGTQFTVRFGSRG